MKNFSGVLWLWILFIWFVYNEEVCLCEFLINILLILIPWHSAFCLLGTPWWEDTLWSGKTFSIYRYIPNMFFNKYIYVGHTGKDSLRYIEVSFAHRFHCIQVSLQSYNVCLLTGTLPVRLCVFSLPAIFIVVGCVFRWRRVKHKKEKVLQAITHPLLRGYMTLIMD